MTIAKYDPALAVLTYRKNGEWIPIAPWPADEVVVGERMPPPHSYYVIPLTREGADRLRAKQMLPPAIGTRVVFGDLAGSVFEADAFDLDDGTCMLFLTMAVNFFDGDTLPNLARLMAMQAREDR